MNINQLRTVLDSIEEYRILENDSCPPIVLSFGSIVKDEFIPGWSDIDLMALTSDLSPTKLQLIYSLQEKLAQITKLKTGITVYPLANILEACHQITVAQNYLPYLKNFHQSCPHALSGIILSPTQNIPLIPDDFLKKLDLKPYIYYTQNAVIKLFSEKNLSLHNKYLLRKATKNTLFILQTLLMKQEGRVTFDLERVLLQYRQSSTLDLQPLTQAFSLRFKWSEITDSDISTDLTTSVFNLFNYVCQNPHLSKC
jgi:predicted nucleotidyltransferase